ncbi:uncharacterized protein LOC129593882 [Paramacrobiotus metropolitanus]|uniref:uncharacterized protein LOC129593882 n=1 Tax=Paramacrobiotus metropolitanus TaxID=2943436 RepID=UPI00244654E4|nr:uncharacterized protein LOC129593882 [Paramacrobiotus metropolitanus]
MAHCGLEDDSPRLWSFQQNVLRYGPDVGTYDPHSNATVNEPLGIHPPFGSFQERSTLAYMFEKGGRETPAKLYDTSHKKTKNSPQISSDFKSIVPRFQPLKPTGVAPCDHNKHVIWFPTHIPRPTPQSHHKVMALLLTYLNQGNLARKGFYDGPNVSPRGRAHGYTVDASGNVFEKGADNILICQRDDACSQAAEPFHHRFYGGGFSRATRGSVFPLSITPGPGAYESPGTMKKINSGGTRSAPVHPVLRFEQEMALDQPNRGNDAFFPGTRTSQTFCSQTEKQKSLLDRDLVLEKRINRIIVNHGKMIDQYMQAMNAAQRRSIGFSSTTKRVLDVGLIDMDIPASSAYVDPRSAIKTGSYPVKRPANKGFLATTPRFKTSAPNNMSLFSPTEFLNVRQQIHNAQTHIRAAFGSGVPRAGTNAAQISPTPAPNTYSIPATIAVVVRGSQVKKDRNGIFPWQGWREKEGAHKRYLDRIPAPGWYDVARADRLTRCRRSFHRPYLARVPPAFNTTDPRKPVALNAARDTPGANRYSCKKWAVIKKVTQHGPTVPKAKMRSLFSPKAKGPGPADYKVATILSSSVARSTFNVRYTDPYRRPWTQIHPPVYNNYSYSDDDS